MIPQVGRTALALCSTTRSPTIPIRNTVLQHRTSQPAIWLSGPQRDFEVNENISMIIEAVKLLDQDERKEHTTGLSYEYLDAGRRIQEGIRITF